MTATGPAPASVPAPVPVPDRAALRARIARRVARELHDGDVVNLGIGLPTLVPSFLPPGVGVVLEAEDGIVGATGAPEPGTDPGAGDPPGPVPPVGDVVDAGGRPAGVARGGAYLDSATSFALIRGGHVDVTVLGALEVDAAGNLANWIVPGRSVPGMGGAMDLVVGARRVVVATEHTQRGAPKILGRCTLPLTATACVDLIVTELAVLEVTPDGLLLTEIAPGTTVEDLRAVTDAPFAVADPLLPLE